MLALPIRNHGELIALEDDALPDQVYVALNRPQVVRGANGLPRLRLLRWVTGADGAGPRTTGGRLTIDVDTRPSATQLATARLPQQTVLPLPWLDARVRLEGPQFEPVEAEATLTGAGAAAVAVELSATAASLLAPLLQGDHLLPLQLTWTGHVLVRLPPVEVIAIADVSEVRRRIELAGASRQATTTRSIIDANVHLEIRGTDRAALEQALREWVLDELTRRLAQGLPLSVRAAAADVVRWPIVLATTLDDFPRLAERSTLVETLVLDSAAVGASPPIEVRVLGDFAGPLERVDFRLTPRVHEAVVQCSIDSAMPRSVALGTTDFRWSHRIKLVSRPVGLWSPWTDAERATSIVLPVAAPSRLDIEIISMGLDFDRRWSAATVVIEHRLPDAPPTFQTIELDAAHRSRSWSQHLDGVRGSLHARITYLARQGTTVMRQLDDIPGDEIIVTEPLEHSSVGMVVVPAGTGWNDVALVMVDLRYVDGAQVVDETVELKKQDDLVEWQAPARPDGPRLIQWRAHASFADGRFASYEWQSTSDGVAVVRIDTVARRLVQIFPLHFDGSVVRAGTVRLQGAAEPVTVAITDRTPRGIALPPGPFTWTVAWTAADGTDLGESAPEPGDDVIVLPRVSPG